MIIFLLQKTSYFLRIEGEGGRNVSLESFHSFRCNSAIIYKIKRVYALGLGVWHRLASLRARKLCVFDSSSQSCHNLRRALRHYADAQGVYHKEHLVLKCQCTFPTSE